MGVESESCPSTFFLQHSSLSSLPSLFCFLFLPRSFSLFYNILSLSIYTFYFGACSLPPFSPNLSVILSHYPSLPSHLRPSFSHSILFPSLPSLPPHPLLYLLCPCLISCFTPSLSLPYFLSLPQSPIHFSFYLLLHNMQR